MKKNIPDWSEKFGCSVAKAQKQIENGSVKLPASGIMIKSTSSSKRQGKEVYFLLSTGGSSPKKRFYFVPA